MNIKKKVLRLDIVSRTMLDRQNLIRLIKTSDNQVVIDTNFQLKGRGAYIKKDEASILMAKKRNLLAKALRCKVSDCVYEQLLDLIKN